MDNLLLDAIRLVHLVCLALGIGVAALLEIMLLRDPFAVLGRAQLGMIAAGHRLVRFALAGLWVSGLGLFVMRNGLSVEAFTPKLMAKFCVVALLTLNMFAIDALLMRRLAWAEGRTILDLPFLERTAIGAVIGISAGCWGSAMLLGTISAFRVMEGHMLFNIFGTIILGAALVAATLAACLRRRRLLRHA